MKISEKTVEKAAELVRKVLMGTGITVRAEVQDGGEFLLLIAEVPYATENNEQVQPFKQQLLQQLSILIPPKEDGDYSWMVVFKTKDKIVDSVMAGVPVD
ncbi:hypothetical protein KP005_10500 [Geomonas nitrogeniifigens]|uniref:Uncharacterized protein n=1 Tax=Geomonas diazotrophica TaxID=2843197 RepID=A0ABX8JBS8_9BACT|nr:hypothetical protein [Geomonas nitrogeniifigens]QWV95825.1 hypothetical protein KP005_10500 [Geomonas nitrogeniifigens]